MAAKRSIAPAIVWNWVIEALASSEQADISTLIGLVKMAPAISGDAGKDTREIVSLRILESLFDHGNEATVDAKTPKLSFDPSERCEDVLKKILHKTPEQMTKIEKQKWDVGPFLKHKRSSLPKCALKKLKEAILDDSNPLSASLKEKSNLVISNASEDTSLANDELPLNPEKDRNKFQENVLQDDNVPQDTYTEGHSKRVSVDSMEILEFVVKRKDSDNIVQPNNELANDDDDDERNDVAAKKEAFLESQYTISQDSLNLAEWSQIDRCMRCNESGELLLCSSDSCPLRFHESCLGVDVTLDDNGEFLCPFCAYARAISKYQDAKRNASLARKNLQAFSNFTVKPKPNEPATKESELEENDQQMGANNINMSNVNNSAQLDSMIPNVNDDNPSVEQTTELTQNPMPESTTPKRKFKEKENELEENEDRQMGANNINMSNENNPAQPDHMIPDVNDANPSIEQTTELTPNPMPESTTPKRKFKEKESQRSTESSSSIRLRKRKATQYPPPVALLLRRKNLRWTKLEVETLKEGFEKYSNGDNKRNPWKEILDFGHNVFQKGRTPIDLKDKWRNICK